MKKVALLYIAAVFVPSLILAWLAVRSLRDQQFLLERQQSLLYQAVADAKAKEVQEALEDCQRTFRLSVNNLLGKRNPLDAARAFDEGLRKVWPMAEVGFAVDLKGQILSPSPYSRPEARKFCADYGRFLGNLERAEVYLNLKQSLNNAVALNAPPQSPQEQQAHSGSTRRYGLSKTPQARSVIPQQQASSSQNTLFNQGPQAYNTPSWQQQAQPQPQAQLPQSQPQPEDNQASKLAAAEGEFRQLIGEDLEGTLARFVDNKLNILYWCRPSRDAPVIFGAQLSLSRLTDKLRPIVQEVEPALQGGDCVALLDDTARPLALSHPGFRAAWKRPFVATEIGESLPHWEAAVYLADPARLTRSAQALKLTLGLVIAILLLAIGLGSWLIAADLNRQLTLARQKTDFVSNVSHELKTPLTSIRMFSELLAEGRVADPAKQRSYLDIITSETARLTRLINNVLDFARLERGEKKYKFQKCDVARVAGETAAGYRPQLEAGGFQFDCELPDSPALVNGDPDALAQVIVNLLSNGEKYSGSRKEIVLRVRQQSLPLPQVEVQVLDRGLGVPKGCQEKIFEKFYRAHDSLSSGIQGSGLGLSLARQIARAHGGEVVYEARPGGGSCFSLRLPSRTGERPEKPTGAS
ncbi:MAG: HAMP domain-containing sensor histidine kinase [Verrucomicrobiota bacterium]|jgi:signal transduction histidine kinase